MSNDKLVERLKTIMPEAEEKHKLIPFKDFEEFLHQMVADISNPAIKPEKKRLSNGPK